MFPILSVVPGALYLGFFCLLFYFSCLYSTGNSLYTCISIIIMWIVWKRHWYMTTCMIYLYLVAYSSIYIPYLCNSLLRILRYCVLYVWFWFFIVILCYFLVIIAPRCNHYWSVSVKVWLFPTYVHSLSSGAISFVCLLLFTLRLITFIGLAAIYVSYYLILSYFLKYFAFLHIPVLRYLI